MIVMVDENNIVAAGKIHSESWKESHKAFCSTEFINLHSAEHQTEYLRNEISAGKQIYMLTKDKPVGIVSVYKNLIENLYVLPQEQGKGYGTELLMFAVGKCLKPHKPTLWILSNNKKAYRMYLKHGFCKTGRKNQLSEDISEFEMIKL